MPLASGVAGGGSRHAIHARKRETERKSAQTGRKLRASPGED